MRQAEETVEHVRRLLGPANPVGPDEYTDDPEARRALTRILADRKRTPKARPHRRRWMVVTGSALALVGAGTVADASGIIPTSVTKGLLRGEEPHTTWGKLKTSKARVLVEARGPRGVLTQWWFAPGAKGGGCTYARRVTIEGGKKHSDGSTECSGSPGPVPPATEKLNIRYSELADGWMGVVGRAAPPATQIRVTLRDGRRVLVPVRAGGFFMQFLELRVAPYGPAYPGQIQDHIDATALDANGRPIKSVRADDTAL